MEVVQIRDKGGRVLTVRPCGREGLQRILAFYDRFEPKGEFQGIPPAKKRARGLWVEDLRRHWQNFLILDGDRVVGHVGVALGEGEVRELIIFLHQDYRGRGIGSGALRGIRGMLERQGGGKLWLTVQNTNIVAMRCFRKVGFEFVSPAFEPEREMVLDMEKTR